MAAAIASVCFGVKASVMGVEMNPGAMQLAVMPRDDDLPRQRLGHADQPRLGGGVVRLARIAENAGDRGDIDDAPGTAAHHVAQDAAGQDEHRGQVDGDDVVPLFVLHAHEQIVVGNAGIVDQDVDLAESLLRFLAEFGHCGAVAEIARQHEHAAAELAGESVELILVGARNRDGRALCVQRLGDRPADAAGGAGDQRAFALRSNIVALLF